MSGPAPDDAALPARRSDTFAPAGSGDRRAARFAARDRETLSAIASGPLPGGLAATLPETGFFRDVFYDTPDEELDQRGVRVHVRFHATGTATFLVEAREAPGGGGGPVTASAETETGDARELFEGDTAPARLLRAIVDPARLEPWIEVETRREARRAWLAGGGDPSIGEVVEIVCDARTVREHDLSATLSEVEVRGRAEAPALGAALRALEEDFRLELLGDEDPLHRARRSLEEVEVDWLEDAVRTARRVAVVPWRGGRALLLRDARGVRVPAGDGSGEEVCRRVLRQVLDVKEAHVRRLGTGPGSPRNPATEVWLAEGMDDESPPTAPEGTEIVALPLGELLHSVGSPPLRDGATLSALHVLARSGLPVEPAEDDEPEMDAKAARAALYVPGMQGVEDAEAAEALGPGTLLNMELSLLAFNRRVLALAEDERVPLLERVRFLSIFGANLDEFFRVRVSGFKRQVAVGSEKPTMDGVAPREQLDAIGARARRLFDRAYALLFDALLPALEKAGVRVLRAKELKKRDRSYLRDLYDQQVHALLTPLAAGPGHPFPHIRNQRPAIVGVVRQPQTGAERLAVVELPDGLPRFVPLPDDRGFVPLETVILESFHRLYPGMEVETACSFRVTRSAELHLERAPAGDLLQAVEEEVRQRRFRPVVRLEVEERMPDALRAELLRELQLEAPALAAALGEEDVYEVDWLIDLTGLKELASVDLPALHWPPEVPAREPLDPERTIFDQLQEREVLVSFPHDSFEATVERFVLEAADDPAVVAIKLALYRTNRKSRIVEALRRASARGKQVVALVELTARFDEQRNIGWARYLRSSGIHVLYGVPGLKIHAKVALVVRREGDVVRRYAYVGTGNLNAATASAYTDLGLLSADPGVGEEASELFNLLTGAAGEPRFRRLLVAPHTMRRRFLEMLEREMEHARAGRGGHVVAKINGLADREMIAALYRASRAGVRIELIVRSICALRPGVAGLSENVRVFSILGRYLEHARIWRFANGGDPEHYIGSADWRTRNLSRRVEVVAPVRDPAHRARLDAILRAQLNDPDAWELGADGTYYRRPELAPRDPALPPSDPERAPILTPDA